MTPLRKAYVSLLKESYYLFPQDDTYFDYKVKIRVGMSSFVFSKSSGIIKMEHTYFRNKLRKFQIFSYALYNFKTDTSDMWQYDINDNNYNAFVLSVLNQPQSNHQKKLYQAFVTLKQIIAEIKEGKRVLSFDKVINPFKCFQYL